MQIAWAEQVKPDEHEFVLQKFGMAIILVCVFGAVIYFALIMYKKYFLNIPDVNENKTENPKSFVSPKNIEDSIKNFLEKTKPDQ